MVGDTKPSINPNNLLHFREETEQVIFDLEVLGSLSVIGVSVPTPSRLNEISLLHHSVEVNSEVSDGHRVTEFGAEVSPGHRLLRSVDQLEDLVVAGAEVALALLQLVEARVCR